MSTENKKHCRFGITTDLADRESDWRREYPSLRNWRTASGPYNSREEAQAEESRLADLYGCVAHPGGANPKNANAQWYVYTFEYDVITPCAASVLFGLNAGALAARNTPAPALNGLVPPPMQKIGAAALNGTEPLPSPNAFAQFLNEGIARATLRENSANSAASLANRRVGLGGVSANSAANLVNGRDGRRGFSANSIANLVK